MLDNTRTIITNDLRWDLNTANIVKKANARMQLLRKVASFGTIQDELKNVYIVFRRSLLEQSATVWHSSLSQENSDNLERLSRLRAGRQQAVKSTMKVEGMDYKEMARYAFLGERDGLTSGVEEVRRLLPIKNSIRGTGPGFKNKEVNGPNKHT